MTPPPERWTLLAPPPESPSSVSLDLSPPSFSVVIAAYNAEDFIADAIDSVLAQTVPAAEIVVCDDASSDRTVEIVRSYGDRVTLVRNERNRGPAQSRNEAAAATTGDFIAVLDADDTFHPERLEALQDAALRRPDLDLITSDAFVEVAGETIGRYYNPTWSFEAADQRSEILRRNFVFTGAAIRREPFFASGGYPELRASEDWALWAQLILSGSCVGCIAEPLAIYRDRPDSLSANLPQMLRSELETLRGAAAHPSLTPAERAVVSETIRRTGRDVARQDAQDALLAGRPGARRLSWALARYPGAGLQTRLKAGLAVVAPRLMSRRLRRLSAGGSGD